MKSSRIEHVSNLDQTIDTCVNLETTEMVNNKITKNITDEIDIGATVRHVNISNH